MVRFVDDDGVTRLRGTLDPVPASSVANGYDRLLASIPVGPDASVWSLGVDGRAPIQVTPTAAGFYDYMASWEPVRRQKIVYLHYENATGRYDILTLDTVTGASVNLTTGYNPGSFIPGAFNPSWSPDGTRIAFVQSDNLADTTNSVRVMSATDGSGKAIIAQGDYYASDSPPAWSPDGSQLAFAGADGTVPLGVYVFASDGSGGSRVYDSGVAKVLQVAWSSKDALAVAVNDAGTYKLYTMAPDGSGAAQLGTIDAAYCSWSPDGTRIAVVVNSTIVGTSQNGIIDLAGNVSALPATDGYPVFWGQAADLPPYGNVGPLAAKVDPASITFAADLVTALVEAGLMQPA